MPINKRTIEEKKLKQQSRISVKEGAPSKSEGIEGELSIRKIKGKGVFLFAKVDGIWRSRALYRGIAEAVTSSPGKDIALVGWNPERKVYEPLDTSEIFTRKTRGGKSKLQLGSTRAKNSSAIGEGDLTLGNDTKTQGNLFLGVGATTGTTSLANIAVGYTDDIEEPGLLRILSGFQGNTNYHEMLRLGSATVAAFRFYFASTSTPFGGLLRITAAPNGVNPTIADGQPGIFVEAASSGTDHILKFKNSTGTHSLSHCLPLSGGAMTGAITTNSTFDGVDIATRDGVLTSTTTTANAALPKAGGTMSGDLNIAATDKLTFDGGGDTYIHESSADVLDIKVGGDMIFQITESGADGNTIDIDNACIGFTQLEPTYDAANTVVDFRHSNKQNLTFGAGNIGHLQLYFPLVSGNFQLLIKQDGTGSRTITGSYKVFEFDGSAADGEAAVKFAGGSAPTLTTDANHVDILSFYWDADNEIAYGVATLDFQF